MYKRIISGNTALITGASSGIGLTFATKLAKLGVNLILVARRINLLNELKSKIESEFQVSVQVFCADLSKPNWKEEIPNIFDFDIDYLISNAGTGYPGEFGTRSFEEDLQLVQLNCITPLELTHIFLPRMKERKKGGIIFVSSTMGMHGIPYMAQYSSTKGYLLNLGESLYSECKPYNVDIEVLMPGATRTPGILLFDVEYEKLPISWMEPDEVVDIALKHLGKKALVIPGFRNWFLQGISTCLTLRTVIQKILKKYADKTINKKDFKTSSVS